MNVATIQEVGTHFKDYVKASESSPVVVTRKGKPVAVLLATKNDDDLERLLLGHSQKLQAILEAARNRFREGAGIPHEEFWRSIEAESVGAATKRSGTKKSGGARRSGAKSARDPHGAK